MRFAIIGAGLLALAVAGLGEHVKAQETAQQVCGKSMDDMLKAAQTSYDELPVFAGVSDTSSGVVVIITANLKTGTYTVFGASPGRACVLDAGQKADTHLPATAPDIL